MKINFENKDNYYLLFILLLAGILRFYNAFEIPFTHDEFSALIRTNFDSFSELIKGGVLTDTHPAGVQVFIFYWIKLVGQSSFAVKFPFILMGLGSVFLTWKLAKAWYNTSVAILSALLLACLEYPLMYSQIARPYISGLFLSLWMVYHWRAYIFDTKSKWNLHWVFFVAGGVLSAYNHHFSLLFAAIVGLSGLLFISREKLLAYASAGLTIFILYIPHLPIFFHQLDKGGVGGEDGWLGAPKEDFLWNYIEYIFNYSWLLLAIVLILVILSLPNAIKNFKLKWKMQVLFLLWFLIPFLIGYFYSVMVNPVIQYSVLIFSFPFLFFILFGFLPDIANKYRLIIVAIILPVLLYTSIVDRQYYPLFYNSPYKGVVDESRNFSLENKGETFAIIDSRKEINEYYLDRIGRDFNFNYLGDFEDRKSVVAFISNVKSEGLSYGFLARSDPMFPAIIADHFPYLEKKVDYNQGNFYAFSKKGKSKFSMYREKDFKNPFNEDLTYWDFNNESLLRKDTIGDDQYYGFTQGQEWGVSLSIPFDELNLKENDLIDIRLDVYPNNEECELLIVSEIYRDEEKYDWRSSLSKDFIVDKGSDHFRMYHCIKLSDLNYPDKGASLKIYLWNKGKTKLQVDNFDISVRVGNPIFYGLLNKMN